MLKVMLIGPNYRCKGGIASVLRNYLEYPDKKDIVYGFISVRGDGCQFIKLLQLILGLIKLSWTLATDSINIVHAHPSENLGFYRYIPFLLVSKCMQKKVIFHIHGGMFDEFYKSQSSIQKKIVKSALLSCDMVICLSEYWASVFRHIGVSKIVVIKNTVFQPETNPYNPLSNGITFMGFIEPRKGIYDLIKALPKIDKHIELTLNICGSGDDSTLDALINVNKSNVTIIKHGWIDSKQKDAILRDTLIFILPSYHEGLPMVVLEAMAYGVPVISTPVGGIPELIENGIDGFLVNPGDINALTKAINQLNSDRDLRIQMSKASFAKIKDGYTMDASFKALHRVYSQLMKI
jgi:glycosyltransferase involved in cell wall biosynthesis